MKYKKVVIDDGKDKEMPAKRVDMANHIAVVRSVIDPTTASEKASFFVIYLIKN
jgi:hypothetical protein